MKKEELLLEIRKKKKYLKRRLAETKDVEESRFIAFSLSNYLEMEFQLSNSDVFINKASIHLFHKSILMEKEAPYLKKIRLNSNYYFQKLNSDYVSNLLYTLSSASSFKIPVTFDGTDDDLIELTKQFYHSTFTGKIHDSALELLNYHSVYFMDRAASSFDMLGKNYADPYFGDNYSFIYRKQNDIDLLVVPHEIFHGVHFKLNPKDLFTSVFESKEAAPTAIEFMFCDFLQKNPNFRNTGENIKKLEILRISNEANILDHQFLDSSYSNEFVRDFLLLEAKIVGYGIYQEYLNDPHTGEEKIMKLIAHYFDADMLPNYSELGFSQNKIISLANQLVQERNYILTNTQKSL